MKIAIASDSGYVSGHFGHCEEYLLFHLKDGEVVEQRAIPTPSHKPCSLPEYLAKLGVNCVIAGGMGSRAQQHLSAYGIEVLLGAQGTISDTLSSYLAGTLSGGEGTCSHSRHGCESHEEPSPVIQT